VGLRRVNAVAVSDPRIRYGHGGARNRGARSASESGRARGWDRKRIAGVSSTNRSGDLPPAQERQFMADVFDVTDQTFEAEVLQSDKPTIIDFWAEWCAPCRQIAPIVKELAAQYGDKLKVVKLDIDSNPSTPGKFGIRAIPTILAFKDGEVVQQLQGARPKADFETMVQNLLS
jgi:thioredoxin 1